MCSREVRAEAGGGGRLQRGGIISMGLGVIAWIGDTELGSSQDALGSSGPEEEPGRTAAVWTRSAEPGFSMASATCFPKLQASRRWRRAPVSPHRQLCPYLGDVHAISDTVDAQFVDLTRIGMKDDLRSRQNGVRLEQRDVSKDQRIKRPQIPTRGS